MVKSCERLRTAYCHPGLRGSFLPAIGGWRLAAATELSACAHHSRSKTSPAFSTESHRRLLLFGCESFCLTKTRRCLFEASWFGAENALRSLIWIVHSEVCFWRHHRAVRNLKGSFPCCSQGQVRSSALFRTLYQELVLIASRWSCFSCF